MMTCSRSSWSRLNDGVRKAARPTSLPRENGVYGNSRTLMNGADRCSPPSSVRRPPIAMCREGGAPTRALREERLAAMEPDIIGECFVLEHLARLGFDTARESLVSCAWALDPVATWQFVARAANNFPSHPMMPLLAAPLEQTPAHRLYWALLVQRVIAQSLWNTPAMRLGWQLLQQLRTLGEGYPGELLLEMSHQCADMLYVRMYDHVHPPADISAIIDQLFDRYWIGKQRPPIPEISAGLRFKTYRAVIRQFGTSNGLGLRCADAAKAYGSELWSMNKVKRAIVVMTESIDMHERFGRRTEAAFTRLDRAMLLLKTDDLSTADREARAALNILRAIYRASLERDEDSEWPITTRLADGVASRYAAIAARYEEANRLPEAIDAWQYARTICAEDGAPHDIQWLDQKIETLQRRHTTRG